MNEEIRLPSKEELRDKPPLPDPVTFVETEDGLVITITPTRPMRVTIHLDVPYDFIVSR